MQKVSLRKVKTAASVIEPTNETILHFELAKLLPAGQILALHTKLNTLTLLALQPDASHPLVLGEQQFSVNEMRVLLPLLQLYPRYCPYEVMLASFNCGNTSEEMVERFRVRLEEARFADVWDYEMRPTRNILSRTRFKLRELGIEVSSILETGYLLIALPMRA